MATVTELIDLGHEQLESLRLEPFSKQQLTQTLDGIERGVTPAREKVSEALTILRDPAMAGRLAHATTAAADRLEQALRWLDGQATVADS